MKRLTLLFAAFSLLVAVGAPAKQMVVRPAGYKAHQAFAATDQEQREYDARDWVFQTQIFDRLGIDYDAVPFTSMTGRGNATTYGASMGYGWGTEWLRNGYTVIGGDVPRKVQYAGVIFPNWFSGTTTLHAALNEAGLNAFSTVPAGMPRTDSLFKFGLALGGFQVPTLFILDHAIGIVADAAACSLGVKTSSGGNTAMAYYVKGRPMTRFFPSVFTAGASLNPATVGGVRSLLGQSAVMDMSGVSVNWPDSMPSLGSTPDTAVVWERLFTPSTDPANPNVPHAARMVVVMAYGAGGSDDSLSSNSVGIKPFCEGDPLPIIYGLAHYDSLLGGGVIFSKAGSRGPITTGIVVRRGLSRQVARAGRGAIMPADTSAFYASCDSLAKWGVPMVWAINPDSSAAFARDLQKMMSNPNAKFTPEVWTGVIDTATSAGGNTSAGMPVDVYGQWRQRAAYGDGSATGADTSLWANLKWSFAKVESLVGRDRVSHIAIAPNDDWSPLLVNKSNPARVDSILWAISKVCPALLFNRQFSGADAYGNLNATYPNRANPAGYYGQREEGGYSGHIPGTSTAWALNFVGHTGSGVYGAVLQGPVFDGVYAYGTLQRELSAYWGSLFLRSHHDHDVFVYDNTQAPSFTAGAGTIYPAEDLDVTSYPAYRRASIKQLYCSDLSGDPANPARTGLWAIKYIYYAINAINAKAGRTIISLTYADKVQP